MERHPAWQEEVAMKISPILGDPSGGKAKVILSLGDVSFSAAGSAARWREPPDFMSLSIGFRIVLEVRDCSSPYDH